MWFGRGAPAPPGARPPCRGKRRLRQAVVPSVVAACGQGDVAGKTPAPVLAIGYRLARGKQLCRAAAGATPVPMFASGYRFTRRGRPSRTTTDDRHSAAAFAYGQEEGGCARQTPHRPSAGRRRAVLRLSRRAGGENRLPPAPRTTPRRRPLSACFRKTFSVAPPGWDGATCAGPWPQFAVSAPG